MNLRQRVGNVTAWSDNRIIHSNKDVAKINQFYCQRCKRAHNDLVVYKKDTYCEKCFPGTREELDKLPIYSQDGRRLK